MNKYLLFDLIEANWHNQAQLAREWVVQQSKVLLEDYRYWRKQAMRAVQNSSALTPEQRFISVVMVMEFPSDAHPHRLVLGWAQMSWRGVSHGRFSRRIPKGVRGPGYSLCRLLKPVAHDPDWAKTISEFEMRLRAMRQVWNWSLHQDAQLRHIRRHADLARSPVPALRYLYS